MENLKEIKVNFTKHYFNEQKLTYDIYVDMDGVLVGFETGYNAISDVPFKKAKDGDMTVFWKPVNDAGYEWWANLPWTNDGKELWEYVKKYNPTILTAPSRGDECPKGKKIWVKRELGEDIPIILEKDKYKYSGKNKILIDDTEEKINAWVDKGGIGILHTSTKDTIEKLKGILTNDIIK